MKTKKPIDFSPINSDDIEDVESLSNKELLYGTIRKAENSNEECSSRSILMYELMKIQLFERLEEWLNSN